MELTPQRLGRIIDNAFAKTKNQRQSRVRFLSQISGRFFRNNVRSGDESSKASPVNMMNTAYNTLIPNLVFANPKADVSIDVLAYRDYGHMIGTAITRVAEKQNLKHTMRLVIADSIVMAGYVKTGEAVGAMTVELQGVDYNLTEPFIERISPDDMIQDPDARAWDEQAIVGHRYRADVDKMIEEGFGEPDELLKLADELSFSGTKDRAEGITRPSNGTSDEPRRYVDLVEIWIPGEKRVVTMPYKVGMTFDTYLNDVDYGGPPKGQYHQLGLVAIPDNLLPAAPAGIWYDLHILGNRIARKIARQAERNKRVLAYEDDAEEDVNAVADADDGTTVRVQNLDKMREVEYGGVSEKAYEWMTWLKQNFSEQSGTVEQLGGPTNSSPTLGQAEIIQANTSVRLGDMQGIVYDFVGEVLNDTGYSLHTDPFIDMPLVRRVNGVEQQDYFTPDNRVGEWYEYNVKVRPFSMARPDPNTAVRRKLEFATNVIPAAANAAAVLGPGFRIAPFLTTIAREVGIEDADEWLVTPEIQQYIQMQMLLSQKTGDPGKANQFLTGLPPAALGMAQPYMGMNPNQPNPSAMGPTGGVSVDTERNRAAQEASADAQSTRAMGLARGF